MATRIYGASKGEQDTEVTEGVGSATTDSMEFTFDLADGVTMEDIELFFKKVLMHMRRGIFPPA